MIGKVLREGLRMAGVDPWQLGRTLRGLPAYFAHWSRFRRQQRLDPEPISWGVPYPRLDDRFAASGTATGHYFHQDLWVARRIFENRPEKHIDVGSRVDGFVAHVAAFREIEALDIRPTQSRVHNIRFRQADIMSPDFALREECDSLSCLHVLEHLGLGRYGDPIDHRGHLRGLENLRALLKPGGKFYLSTPIGESRVEFNAHRVFSVGYLLDHLRPNFQLEEFSYVDDEGDFHPRAPLGDQAIRENYGCRWGCGIFELTKKS